ncbi:MAG: TetR/AcrR family transcriptional regulator C-terminal domain-containing protein [Actinobacteria bacterium]|nr:TetR/AcrR family transcriptional regulator C-terminal domain-containing protein [Actinomycetota bacterium]
MSSRRPLPRGTLTPGLIVGAALALVDRDGLDALTMRRLAAELGCEAMSLYKHVPDKATLLQMVIDHVMSDFRTPSAALGWDDRLRAVARDLRRLALAHPHVVPLLAVQLPSSAMSLVPVDAVLGALHDAGLDDERVVGLFWALVAYVTGALVAEAAAVTGVEQPFPFGLSGDATEHLPHVARLGRLLATSEYEVEFERGLELFIDAVERAGAS